MFIDFNLIIKNELDVMNKVIETIESLIKEKEGAAVIDNEQMDKKECLYVRCTSKGIVYNKRTIIHGKRVSRKLGGPDNEEVIRIKQNKYEEKMLDILKKNRAFLERNMGKFIPYDPDSIDERIDATYRDYTGLVNKAPGIVDMKVWNGIVKKNSYQMPDKPNIATDGLEARSKSELVVYGILKGYGLIIKYDYEITLIDESGHPVSVSPDFIILCNDGSLIIIEHLGLMDDIQYLDKKIKRIHLYQINGYKLNDTLFLTSDYAKGKIDAQVIDEMVRKMILPRVKGIVK